MTEEKLCGGKTFNEVMEEVNFHIFDKHKIEQLQKENAKLKKQNEELVKLSQNRGTFIDWCCSKHPKIIIQYLEE